MNRPRKRKRNKKINPAPLPKVTVTESSDASNLVQKNNDTENLEAKGLLSDLKKSIPTSILSLLLATIPFVFASLQTLIFTTGDIAVSLSIISSINIFSLLFDFILKAFPVLVVSLILVTLDHYIFTKENRRKISFDATFLYLIIMASLFILMGFLTNLGFFLVACGVTIALLALKRLLQVLNQFFDSYKVPTYNFRLIPLMVVAALLLELAYTAIPGVEANSIGIPLEKLSQNHNKTIEGYVLSTENGWIKLVTKEKTIAYIQSDQIISRTVCNQNTTTTLARIIAEPLQPKC